MREVISRLVSSISKGLLKGYYEHLMPITDYFGELDKLLETNYQSLLKKWIT